MAVLRLVEDRPPGTELRALVAEHLPDLDAPAMAFAVRNKLAMVQVPPGAVGAGRAGADDDGGGVAGPAVGGRARRRRRRAAVPGRLRPGGGGRRGHVVPAHRAARGGGPCAAPAPAVPGRAGPPAVRPARRPGPIRARRHRSGSCPSTTTSCSATTTAAGSSARAQGGRRRRLPPGPRARCSTTAPSGAWRLDGDKAGSTAALTVRPLGTLGERGRGGGDRRGCPPARVPGRQRRRAPYTGCALTPRR